jgi:hypothetical protein
MVAAMGPYLLHPAALAIRLSTNYRQATKLIESGELPVVTLPNGELRVDPADVRAWIQRSKLNSIQKEIC